MFKKKKLSIIRAQLKMYNYMCQLSLILSKEKAINSLQIKIYTLYLFSNTNFFSKKRRVFIIFLSLKRQIAIEH